ncbi:MBL fold metallo-hydrolase [bacterium]|nr:MBL fold metallo-hydrolase [bacterium]
MFGNVPKVLWSKTNPSDELNRIDLALRSLLIFDDKSVILVDTGIGQKWTERSQEIYKIDFSTYNLESSLAKFGFTKDDVSGVILTHLHFDHAGGSTYTNETGEILPTFPNAKYYVHKKNWEHANNPSEREKASYLKENFVPLYGQGKLELLETTDFAENIELLESNGHTIGMHCVKISDKKNTVVYCADLIPTSSHVPVPFTMGYDIQPLVIIEEKKKILAQAVKENWILFFEHDPYGEACKVASENGKFKANEKITL